TSHVFAKNGSGRPFVKAARANRPKIHRRCLESAVIGVTQIAIEVPRASQWALESEARCLSIGAGEKTRSRGSEFLVGRNQGRMGKFVAQLDSCAQRPTRQVTPDFHFCVLRTGSGDEAHPAADGMAPAHIEDVVIDLPAGYLRKLKQLKSVDSADLIMAGKQ